MGIIIVRKRGAELNVKAPELGEKIVKEINYWGRNSGSLVAEDNTVRYLRRNGKILAQVTPGVKIGW